MFKNVLFLSALTMLFAPLTVSAEDSSNSMNDASKTIASSHNSDSSDMHMHMEHDESGELPEGIKEAKDPQFKEGDRVILDTDHMPGMQDAKAEIVGAFDTIAYEVTYEDSETGELVEEHRWVVHEETKEGQEQEEREPFEVGDMITIEADHMKGMKGQEAEITDVQETVVYMVDYIPTNEPDAEPVRNHKWVTEEEVKPVDQENEDDASASSETSESSEE